MDLLNGNGENAEAMASTLKDMLKINGNPKEASEKDSTHEESNEDENKEIGEGDISGARVSNRQDQTIDLSKAADGECIPIFAEKVTILTSPNSDMESESSGSNQVRIRPITKFEWEHKYYNGNLVSVTTDYAAYAIKSRSCAIRIINLKNTSDRLLLRGFTAPVCDVSFAHSNSTLISGIDEDGNFIIWQLTLNGENTSSYKKLHVEATPEIKNEGPLHRLVWLTFMHCDIDGNNEGEVAEVDGGLEADPVIQKKLLAITHGSIAEVWDINAAFEVLGSDSEPTAKEKLEHVFMTIVGHDDVISDCELSPEGSVLAVASHDGFVKFWQISIESTEEPTCLHRWKPHGTRPVSLVTFCDDRKQPHLVLYWRFMLTGCNQNNELKIWCTVTWSCLQCISFEPPPGISQPLPALKCSLHAASDYLVVSDVNRKVVYVMRCVTDLRDERACLRSISQYLLTSPLLSFAIVDCVKCKFKNAVAMDEDGDGAEEGEDQEDMVLGNNLEVEVQEGATNANDLNRRRNGVLIKLISVHTKSLEHLNIRFIPSPDDSSSLSQSTYNTISEELNVISVDDSLSQISPSLDHDQSQDDSGDPAQDEEAGEEDTSNNKTALTAQEAEQSTILAGNEDGVSADQEEEEQDATEIQGEKFDSPSADPPVVGAGIMDLVGDVMDELPVAHSSPSSRRHYSLPEDSSGRMHGGEEGSDSPIKSDPHPVLLTPDAFTSSLRKPDGIVSADTSFTHVTPFSVEHPSLFSSERDKSISESVMTKSPIMPSTPPGFSSISGGAGFTSDHDLKPSSSPLVPVTHSSHSSLELGGPSSYHSMLHSLTPNEPGPFGDVHAAGYITKDKSPDLISSASTLDGGGSISQDGRVLVGGPLSGAVGGSGDALFLIGPPHQANQSHDKVVDAKSQSSVGAKRSDSLPMTSSAPWPKAPDVTMSRPTRRLTPTSSDQYVKANTSAPPSQSQSRPDSVLHADVVAEDQARQEHYGVDLLAAIMNLQKEQAELMRAQQKEINKKTNQIAKNVDSALKKFEQQQGEKLDRAIRAMTDAQRKFQTESRAYNVTASENVAAKMDRAVRHEMKNTVLPNLSRSMDTLKDQLHGTLAQKLTATDSLLKEGVGRMVRSKETVDAIGTATGKAIQSQIHNAYRDTFMTSVVPAFEKSCSNMFQQLSITFQRGIDEAVIKLEKQLQSRLKIELESLQVAEKQARSTTAELGEVANQVQSKVVSTLEQKIPLVVSEMKGAQDRFMAEVNKSIQKKHEVTFRELKTTIEGCIQAAMVDLSSQPGSQRTKLPGDKSPRSSGTPNRSSGPLLRPTFEQQQQAILNLLHQGNLNSAFQRALTASDLNLVMYVCEMVDPGVVFGSTPCPLHQPILLSLIQQLACDLGHNTVTKLKYLQEAVMNLDRSHQVTQEHMHTVLDALVKNLNAHIATLSAPPTDASNTALIKQMKMLSMAARSLIQ